MIKEVDLVKVNEEEAALLTGRVNLDPKDQVEIEKAAIAILEQGPTLVVVTLGSEGSYFQIEKGGCYVPPYKVKTIDAIGCGDAFVAGLLTQIIQEGDWKDKLSLERLMEILSFANAVGALTSLKRGAIPAMPTIDDVNKYLEKNN